MSTNLMEAAKKLPYLTVPQLRLAISLTLAAFNAGANKRGVMISSTNEETIRKRNR